MSLFPKALPSPRRTGALKIATVLRSVTGLRAVRFGLVGVVNTLIDLILFSLLVHMAGLPVVPANMLSYGTGILNSFVMNRAWTFKHHSRGKALVKSLLVFTGINLLGLALSTLLVALFTTLMSPILAKIVSVPLVFVWNYLASRHLAFGRPSLRTGAA